MQLPKMCEARETGDSMPPAPLVSPIEPPRLQRFTRVNSERDLARSNATDICTTPLNLRPHWRTYWDDCPELGGAAVAVRAVC